MLPFLQPKKLASVIIANRKSDGTAKPDEHEGEHNPKLIECAEKLISAVHSKSAEGVADAITKAFEHLESGESDASDEIEE